MAGEPSGEIAMPDGGGRISEPSHGTEQVAAEDVEAGDVLLLRDGTQTEVTDVRLGFYYLSDGRGQGLAIGWKSGNASGVTFRRATETLRRL